jgi:hypothetical protein
VLAINIIPLKIIIDLPALTGITGKEHEKVNNYILQIREKRSLSLSH